MFETKSIEKLEVPTWIRHADHDALLNRHPPEHINFLTQLEQISDIQRAPMVDRVKALEYFCKAIFGMTSAHSAEGNQLFDRHENSAKYGDNPVRENEFKREIKQIKRICFSLNYSKHLHNCFKRAQNKIIDNLSANEEWKTLYNNWGDLDDAQQVKFANVFYSELCEYFSFNDKIVTPPDVTVNHKLGGDFLGMHINDTDYEQDEIHDPIELSEKLNSMSASEACGLLFHEGVHHIFNHLHFFAHKEVLPEGHPLQSDMETSRTLTQHFIPLGTNAYISGLNTWHPEEQIAYTTQSMFKWKARLAFG